ncbi:MAG: chromosomal replication initiator protein DnaA [Treponema sp.]|nr:chromosomal replication initiator protein DnaA [Treponema sp.]
MSEQNYKGIWEDVLNIIHEEYKNNNQENFFKLYFNMEYVKDTIDEITVSVPSDVMLNHMTEKGSIKIVKDKILEITGMDININFIPKTVISKNSSTDSKQIKADENSEEAEDKSDEIQEEKKSDNSYNSILNNLISMSENDKDSKAEESTVHNSSEQKSSKKHPNLEENYTFETFVPGENSNFAYNISLGISKDPGRNEHNPLILYGGSGLGKTHLMQSIGNYIYKSKNGNVKIAYLSAENFTNEFIKSFSDKTTEKFKNKFRNLDVLLLDDIHFLIGKQSTQEELFHTFDALRQKKSQMVFTCDRPIEELKGLEERLKTRFSWGIDIDITPPNYETRKAILQKKLDIMGKSIPEDVLDYIAKNVQTNVRDLEKSLNKIIGYAEYQPDKKVTIEIARKELRDTFSQPSNGFINIETIQKVVADHYNISLSDIKSKKRNKKFVIPRQIAIYIARNLLEYSYPELGNEFGGRDHTTMMHSYEKMEEQLKTDSSFNQTIEILIREIKEYRK